MKTLKLALLTLALILVPSFTSAQTALTATTLTAAIGQGTSCFVVGSVTGISGFGPGINNSVGGTSNGNGNITDIYLDRELMQVTSVNAAGKRVCVLRGQGGSQASAHIATTVVWIAPPGAFFNFDPEGACTGASAPQYTPWINQRTSAQWVCSKSGTWVPGFGNPGITGTTPSPTADVASAAGLVTPSGPFFHMTGTNAVTGFNVPTGLRTGNCFTVISDSTWTWTNANNIAVSSTATQTGTTVTFCYDSTATKPFYPSHL